MMSEDSHYDYLEWLISKISIGKVKKHDIGLIEELYFIPFHYSIDKDSHRYDDGISLRELYEFETGNSADWESPCSVLEVLVSIAKNVAEDVIGTHYNAGRTSEWFWMMIENLGLRGVGDTEDPEVKDYIYGVIETWMDRDFDFNGVGSPFPLKNPDEDQRKIEIWKQICAYIVENPWLEK